METYTPIITIEIEATSTYRFSNHYFVDGSNNKYLPWLIDSPDLGDELSDIWHGYQEGRNFRLELLNKDNGVNDTWGTILGADELRGSWITVNRYDTVDASATFVARGKLVDWELDADRMKIRADIQGDSVLDTLLPQRVIDDVANNFHSSGIDVGKPINIVFGNAVDIPCHNVRNASPSYDYVVGFGVLEGIWEDAANGRGVKRDGVLVNTSEYTFYNSNDGSNPYSGQNVAILRFSAEQRGHNGQFHTVTADVKGIKMDGSTAERNFAVVIRELLSDSTWGLDDDVDTTSFATAKTALDTIGSMYCDGAITEQRMARDILADLQRPARITRKRASDGEWEVAVDGTGSAVATFGDAEGDYNNSEVLKYSCVPENRAPKNLVYHYDFRKYTDSDQPYMELTESVRSDFGIDKVVKLPFVREGVTAQKVAGYEKGRSTYGEKMVTLRALHGARNRAVGEIITVIAPKIGLSAPGSEFKISAVDRDNVNRFEIEAWSYSGNIYTTSGSTPPTPPTLPSQVVNGPNSWAMYWEEKSANFTAKSNHYYDIQTLTKGSALTMTLPSDPKVGDVVLWNDQEDSFATYNLIVSRNGKKIEGTADNMTCRYDGDSGGLRYTGTTTGWKLI